ncbi:MAG TPA: sodium:alanine symporter family protein [Acidobacteriota bacterium]|nr:sodium:alanine symporter family protein [Acidobacteriota bacterium]HRR56936.1 sodium:alanine symporter family protein [Acidobacteriota bacterium]
MQFLDSLLSRSVSLAWGPPLVLLLMGGGTFLLFYCRFLPFRRFHHALEILRGKFDRPDAPGEITHFQAVSTALASTIGLGNIGGVAIAITQGGPGALFWMWVAAIVGMATKFFSCSLAVMYRGKDSAGQLQGGPMYYIQEGLGPSFRPLAVFFSLCGTIGCLGIFQANQVAEILYSSHGIPRPWTGLIALLLVAAVMLGGLQRIARVAAALVPLMCLLYLAGVLWIGLVHWDRIVPTLFEIFSDAFTGRGVAAGAAGSTWLVVVLTGVKRAAFSNEAGIGTAPMAHGAARTNEPIREGLVAMVEPFVDTVVVCSLTATAILVTGVWEPGAPLQGIALTAKAFEVGLGVWGPPILTLVALLFGLSTMFGYSYYGRKCFAFLAGAERARYYDYFYLATLFVGSVWTARMVVNLVDTAFALMALPNMLAVLWLSPRVMRAARKYFERA